jgi:5-hydroxyisourate hydrolase-like protein (transthyretin family)
MKRNVHFSRNVSIFTEFKEGRFYFLKKIQKNYISLKKIVYSNDFEVLKFFWNKYETLNNFLKEITTKNKIWKFQKDFLTIQVIGKYIYITYRK